MEYKRDYFDEVKSLCIDIEQLRNFMESEGVSFDGKSSFHCPFHGEDKNASASLKLDRNTNSAYFNCFSCGTGGDAIKFVELSLGLKPLEAAKYVLNYFGVDTNEIALDDEALAAANKKREELAKQRALRAEQNAIKEAKEQAALEARITPLKQKLQDNFKTHYESLEPEISKLFPNYSKGKAIIDRNLGYSIEHKSIAIMIRDDENAVLKNIKYRQKYAWDKARKALSDERMNGKWIGEANSSAYPFPLAEYKTKSKNSECVIICEGEKDALNLFSIGECALTLGGVSASWSKYLWLLKDKIVYVWFDNDHAGYINAVKKAREIESVAKAVYVVLFNKINPSLPSKYDISDYISDNNISENIIERITFSAFKLTNDLIDEISELTDTNLKEYKILKTPKTFLDIKREIMTQDKDENYINIFDCRGEMDEGFIQDALKNVNAVFESKEGQFFKENFIKSFLFKDNGKDDYEKIERAFKEWCKVKTTLLTNYHQTHLADQVSSFLQTLKKLGYASAESKGAFYIWNGSYYMSVDMRELEKFILNSWFYAAKIDVKKQLNKNAIEIAQNIMSRGVNIDAKRKEPLLAGKRVINLLNGSVIISKTGKVTFISEHNKNLCATNMLNFNYDKTATCPKWCKFLDDVISDKDDQKTLMEFMGYCLLPNHNYEAFLFLYGKSGANGKSVILDVLRSFFGDENVSSLQLQQFCGHELHALTNKILNIGSEIDKMGVDNGQLSNLKALVSPKDRIQINPKNQDPYSLEPSEKPKLAFAGNDKPKGSMDNAVFRRMLMISFDKEVSDDKKIRGLSERFDDEKSGIFNMALDGLNRLISQGKFTKSQKMRDELEEYKDEVNPIRRFVREAFIIDENYCLPNKYAYPLYTSWAREGGNNHPMQNNTFFTKLADEFKLAGGAVQTGWAYRPKRNLPGIGKVGVEKHIKGVRLNPDFIITELAYASANVAISEMCEKIEA